LEFINTTEDEIQTTSQMLC